MRGLNALSCLIEPAIKGGVYAPLFCMYVAAANDAKTKQVVYPNSGAGFKKQAQPGEERVGFRVLGG